MYNKTIMLEKKWLTITDTPRTIYTVSQKKRLNFKTV